jgi:hypothetical protein
MEGVHMSRSALFISLVVVTVSLAIASVASASLQTGDIVRFGNGPGTPGGIFYLQDAGGNKITDTFCVQLEEFVSFGGATYKVANAQATSTVVLGSRPLTSFAAWLYDRYLNGTQGVGTALKNFDFANVYGSIDFAAARTQANELQLALWRAMGYSAAEIGTGWHNAYDGKLAGWQSDFQSDVDNQLWSGTGDVYVLNLLGQDGRGDYTVHAQDQLIRATSPPPISVVPEPFSGVVWVLLAVVGTALLQRSGAVNRQD